MTRDGIAADVLAAVAEREEVIATRPDPPGWKAWEWQGLEADWESGPLYSPTWFAELTEAGRVRLTPAGGDTASELRPAAANRQ